MRKWCLLLFDLAIVALSPFVSILIRDNFLLIWGKQYNAIPYAVICVLVSALVFVASDVHRTVWKYISLPDYSLILRAVTAAIGIAVCLVYLNGLQHGIALSVPIIQWAVIVTLMISLRIAVRYIRWGRVKEINEGAVEKDNILIIGLSDVADLYLHWARKVAREKINVVGILDEIRPLKGRKVQSCRVIGAPVDLSQILARYKVHGVSINRVIVTVPLASLSKEAQSIMAYYKDNSGLRFDFLDESFGGNSSTFRKIDEEQGAVLQAAGVSAGKENSLSKENIITLHSPFFSSASIYPFIKRGFDIFFSLTLLVLLCPLILVVGLLVLVKLGHPISFWQQRVGRSGKTFRLYKFRTMSDCVDCGGKMIPDAKRVSGFGHFLRHFRLDELPQLYNILIGEMSFVGPRPLLPIDQPSKCETRLLVRPGLTGWAQVNGGKEVSREDKAVLDIWYLRNLSPYLDLKILLMTGWMIVVGDQLNIKVIKRARKELGLGSLEAGMSAPVSVSDSSGVVISPTSKQKVA